MNLKSLLNTFINTIAVLLAPLTFSILISWNALPGDRLYPLKRALETGATILVSPSYAAQSELQLKLIDRRLNESEQVIIAKHSSAGVIELRTQVQTAKKTIADNPKKVDPKKVTKLKQKLQQTQKELETQKQVTTQTTQTTQINTHPRSPNTPTPTPTSPPPTTPTSPPAQKPTSPPTPTPTPKAQTQQTHEEIDEEIEETQEEIDEVIDELEKIEQQNQIKAPQPTPPPQKGRSGQHRQDQENKNKNQKEDQEDDKEEEEKENQAGDKSNRPSPPEN